MQGRGNRALCRGKEPVCGRLALSMSLRGAQRRRRLLAALGAGSAISVGEGMNGGIASLRSQ